jgi:hypothetical protein
LNLNGRLSRLESIVNNRPEDPLAEHARRWSGALTQFIAFVPEGLQDAVDGALLRPGSSLRSWVLHLSRGNSYLPDNLAEDVMRRLLAIPLQDNPQQLPMVCDECGLERPTCKKPPFSEWKVIPGRFREINGHTYPMYDLPEYFTACPACGNEAWTWISRVHESPQKWQGEEQITVGLRRPCVA